MDTPVFTNPPINTGNARSSAAPTSISPSTRTCDSSPISVLTPNILSRIIHLASTDEEESVDGCFEDVQSTARFVAQVDRRWRFLALQNKAIWLGPVLDWYTPSKWLAEVLRRSDPLPLDVIIPHDAANRCPLIVSLSLMHMCRIRVLQLELVANTWWFVSQSKQFRTQAPLLEKFSLVISSGLDSDRRMRVSAPTLMFGEYAPQLQQLHVRNCTMDLRQPAFSMLRTLFIDQLHQTSVHHVLDALRPMKYLEKLHIAPAPDHLDKDEYMLIPSLAQVYLLNLTELVIAAPLTLCATLLRTLVVPDTCSLEIDAQDVHANGDDLVTLLSIFETNLSHWSCDPLSGQQSLHFGMNEVGYTIAGPSFDGLANHDHPFLSLTLSWFERPSPAEILLTLLPILTTLFSQCIDPPDTLSISASSEIPHQLYPDIRQILYPWLRSIPYIQAIDFRNHSTFALLERLFQGPQRNVLLPQLGDMAFFNVNFRTEKRQYWRRLLRILKFRGSDDIDSPVLQLDFVNCVGDLVGQNLAARFGTIVKIDGRDLSDGDGDDTDEASDYTVQGLSD